MRFGIIGAGVIGGFHAKAIQDMKNGELAGVASRTAEGAKTLAAEYSTRAYPSVEEMLADEAIEIVTVGTPSGAHFEPAMAAIEAGKHVLVEKPLEISTDRIDQMVAAAKGRGVCLSPILNRRFHPAMEYFKQAVEGGRFGQLTSASAYVKWYREQTYYDSAGWRGTWRLDGGGALMNQSIHTIDALLYLAGPVKSLQANTACLAHTNIEVEDIAVVLLEFANGARGVIEGSTCTWSKEGQPARVQLAGTEGCVFLADESFETWEFKNETPEDETIRQTLMAGGAGGLGANDPTAINTYQHQRNFEETVQAIQEGREPSTSSSEARKSVELISAVYKSAREDGKKISLQ